LSAKVVRDKAGFYFLFRKSVTRFYSAANSRREKNKD
jgi:hypothetical protein